MLYIVYHKKLNAKHSRTECRHGFPAAPRKINPECVSATGMGGGSENPVRDARERIITVCYRQEWEG
jgi:hypothetical protein